MMTMEELERLPIPNITSENAALLLWVTFPKLDKQIRLIEKWGFDYKTLGFSWIKTNPKNHKPFFGVGYYAKSNCEVCLLGVKGKMKPISNKVSSCVISVRQEHSRKPDEVRERIVRMFGDRPRIELFARQHAEGWDCWGNEVRRVRLRHDDVCEYDLPCYFHRLFHRNLPGDRIPSGIGKL